MSKELDKVKKISDMVLYNADGYARLPNGEVNLLIAIANNALKRLEAIDNANPSEALECVEEIYDKIRLSQYLGVVESAKLKTNYNTIKQALLKAEELEKENELLKEIIRGRR